MLLALALLIALPQATIHGTVRTDGSLSPLAYATVEIPELGRGVLTDARGYFIFPDVPAGDWRVRVTALGHAAEERAVRVPAQGSVTLELTLEEAPVVLEGVTAEAYRRRTLAGEGGPAPLRITPAVVERMPTLAEPDLFRALQTLPAVQAASDFSSALYVRGGLPDQNLLLLDGAPLFNPYHLGGIFSAFDPAAIHGVELLPGGFPAYIGDRLSSAVDIRTREGGRDHVRGSGAVGLISSRASVDGPLPGGGGGYLVSLRRTYLDLFTDAAHALDLIPVTMPYAFTDAHLKLTQDVGRLGRLSASVYLDEEGFHFPDADPTTDPESFSGERGRFDWGSRMASLAYWQPLGSSWTAEFRAGISDFHGEFGVEQFPWDPDTETYRRDSVGIVIDATTLQRDLFGAADLTHHARGHTTRLGVQVDAYTLDHAVSHDEEGLDAYLPEFTRRDRPTTVAAYAEDEWSATPRLTLRGGLRVLSAGGLGTEWLPRIGARYRATPSLSLSLGASRSAQVLRSLRSEESVWSSVFAYDMLAAVPAESGMSTAEDLVVGAEWRNETTRVRFDTYAKRMHDLPLAPVPDDIIEAPILVPDSVRPGSGTARGLELSVQHARGRSDFSVSYALAFSELELDGERFSPRFERRHILDASAALPLGTSGVFTARMALATGQPYTPILGVTKGLEYDPATGRFTHPSSGHGRTLIRGDHNSARLPGYFRLDVGARKDLTRRWWGREVTLTPYVSVLNVLNTPNVLFAIPEGYDAPRLEYPPQIPIFPTLGIEWKF